MIYLDMDGVIADFNASEQMINALIKSIPTLKKRFFTPSLRMVICIQINNIALYLGYHQRRGCIGKGVLQNIHHDQAGHQKYDKINAISKIATVPNGHRKYQQKQHRSDHWCGQCLQRNIHKSLNFTAVEGDHPDQIDASNRDRPNTVRIRVGRRRASV